MLLQAVASIVDQKNPGLITLERSVNKRPAGRIYVDAHQNSRGQSLAAVYSVRAFPHAPVSVPLTLKELTAKMIPGMWTIKSMPSRIEKLGDLWAEFWRTRQNLDVLQKH